jgi:hypothetical protein
MTNDDLKRVPELYRAAFFCDIGRDTLEGIRKPRIDGLTRAEYALFNLLHAVEEIAEHLAKQPAYRIAVAPDEPQEHFVCPDCGPHVKVDEDGCCAMCGADCTVDDCSCGKGER